MKKENLKQKLVGIIAGTALSISAGCVMQNPSPGYFKERSLVAIPSAPVVMALQGGIYEFEKYIKDGKWIGIGITKKHWALGEQGSQLIMFPEGAENVGIKNEPFLKDRIWVSYDMPDGNRHLDRYDIGFGAGKCKLKDQYIFNQKGEKVKVR